MAKAFSVLSWNVEHFGASAPNKPPRKPVGPIIDLVAQQRADVVAIYEVTGATVFSEVTAKMPNYTFHITEGPQTQEILVGVKKTFSAFSNLAQLKGYVEAGRAAAGAALDALLPY